MARAVYFQDLDDVAAGDTRDRASPIDGNTPARNRQAGNGHDNWSMTAKFKTAGGAPSKVVKLKGSNDPSDTTGETLITITGNAAASFSGSVSGKAYRYVWVSVEAGTDLVLDEVRVWGTGFEGTV